jgi:hypothetical protein
MSATNEYKYREVAEGPAPVSRFLRRYTAPFDYVFARGWIGIIYALWSAFIGAALVTILLDVWIVNFLVVQIFVYIEFAILLIGVIVLAVFARYADRDMRRLRRGFKDGGLNDLINVIRSRANVTSDLNLLSKGLFFSIFELVLVLCVGYGTLNATLLDGDVEKQIVIADDTYILILVKIIYAAILLKAAVILGQSVDRTIAVATREKITKIHATIDVNDDANVEEGGVSRKETVRLGKNKPVDASNTPLDAVMMSAIPY